MKCSVCTVQCRISFVSEEYGDRLFSVLCIFRIIIIILSACYQHSLKIRHFKLDFEHVFVFVSQTSWMDVMIHGVSVNM